MKNITIVLFVFLAATQSFAESNKYAVGMNLVELFQEFDFPNQYESEIYDYIKFPILYGTVITNNFRIEPEFSFWRYSHKDDFSSESYSQENTLSIFHLGIGFSKILKNNEKSNTYLGIKLGINSMSSTSKFNGEASSNKTETKRTDFYTGPALGTEYFLTDQLSLGSEFQFLITFLGKDKVEQSNQQTNNRPDESGSLSKSKLLLYLRLYL